jgi:pilus assembly protein CpaF
MTSGHGGCLTTLHATYPRDVLTRLETMAMMADIEMPLAALRPQIASAIDVVVQVARFRDGTRKITHISEICGFDMDRNSYTINDLFLRRIRGNDRKGRVLSELVPTGNLPFNLEHIEAMGIAIPDVVHEAAARKQARGSA